MKPTDKHKCIVEQWIYGLKVHGMGCFDPDAEETYVMKIVDMDITDNNLRAIVIIHDDIYGDEDTSYLSVEEEISPILRPLSDLTKTITHKGYNDDKPFIPLVELAKITMQDALRKKYWKPEQFILNGDNVELGDYRFSYEKRECFSWRNKFADFQEITSLYQQSIYDLLHLWHFDTRTLIENGDAVDVNTLAKNPYEV